MSVRRRQVRERLERDRNWRQEWDKSTQTLADIKKVIDDALAEGRTYLIETEWTERLAAIRDARASIQPPGAPNE